MELISETFFPIDIAKIFAIPLSKTNFHDERCWIHSYDGVFRVRDAYRLAISLDDCASSSSGPDPIWSRIWKLKIPPKVANFIWRACWDILPNGTNLKKRGVIDVIVCPRCGATETASHALNECQWVRELFRIAGFDNIPKDCGSFRQTISWVLENQGVAIAERYVMLSWKC
ncbi:unnamed protein product [Amaranthus hypochondriacus]